MNHGPIMRGSDKCEKREQILNAFAAQRLPQCLLGALGLRRFDKDHSGSREYPVFGLAVRDGPVDRRLDCRQTLIDRIELAPPFAAWHAHIRVIADGLFGTDDIIRWSSRHGCIRESAPRLAMPCRYRSPGPLSPPTPGRGFLCP
jgi:hypothetical protein